MGVAAIIIGAIFIVVTLVQNLFDVGSAFEELIDDFRPALQDEALAQAETDVAALGAVGDEMQTAVIPGISEALGMSAADFNAFMGSEFPAVATGVQALPEIVPTFQGLIASLADQQELFFSADEIPTEDLPATTVPWGLLFAGIAVMAVGVVMWMKPRWYHGSALSGSREMASSRPSIAASKSPWSHATKNDRSMK